MFKNKIDTILLSLVFYLCFCVLYDRLWKENCELFWTYIYVPSRTSMAWLMVGEKSSLARGLVCSLITASLVMCLKPKWFGTNLLNRTCPIVDTACLIWIKKKGNIEVFPPSKNTWNIPYKLAYQYNLTYESLLILLIQIYLLINYWLFNCNRHFINLRFWHVEQHSWHVIVHGCLHFGQKIC